MGSQEEIMAFLFNPNRRFTFKMLDELSRIENQQFRKVSVKIPTAGFSRSPDRQNHFFHLHNRKSESGNFTKISI